MEVSLCAMLFELCRVGMGGPGVPMWRRSIVVEIRGRGVGRAERNWNVEIIELATPAPVNGFVGGASGVESAVQGW